MKCCFNKSSKPNPQRVPHPQISIAVLRPVGLHPQRLIFDNENGRNKFADHVAKYQVDFNVELPEDFEIVKAAVTANATLLKSRIQLDRNFKIDVGGRRDLIELGFDDEKGKKYIKLYYDHEN